MRMRSTLLLLLLVGGLAVVLLCTDQKPSQKGDLTVPLLSGHHLAEAAAIRWRFANRPACVVRRDGNDWMLDEPIHDLLSLGWFRQVIGSFDSANLSEKPPTIPDTQTGLDQPSLHFEAEFADGTIAVDFGDMGLTSLERFVKKDGVIYRADVGLYTALDVGVDDLRERRVFRNDAQGLKSIRMDHVLGTGARELLVLERDHDQAVRMVQPVACRIEPGTTLAFLSQLLALRIEQFPGSVWRFPERQPDLLIDVQGDAGDEHVDIWKLPDGNLVGRIGRRQLSFQVKPQEFTAVFDNAQGLLRARWLLPMAEVEKQLARVVVDPGEGRGVRLMLERRSADALFRLGEPVDTAAAPTPISEIIQALRNCRVLQFVAGKYDEARFGLGTGAVTVSVFSQYQPDPTVLKLGADDQLGPVAVTYAVRADELDQVVAIPREVADLLRRPWEIYPDLLVLKVGVPVEMLLAQKPTGSDDRKFSIRDGRWYRDGEQLPNNDLKGLIDELRDLHAERALGSRQLGLPAESYVLKLCRGNGDALASLKVWDRGSEAPVLVQAPAQPDLVFELSPYLSGYVRKVWQ